MEKKRPTSTKRIVVAALMAALTVAGSAIRVTLPVDIAGTTSFHLGNISSFNSAFIYNRT